MHSEILLTRPYVDGKPRYQAKCSCGRWTEVGSRKLAQGDQKNHKKMMRREARLSGCR